MWLRDICSILFFDFTFAGLGVLLAGIGSIVSAVGALRVQKKRSVDECEQRLKEYKEALMQGMTLQQREESDERWSHLP